ncbi:type II secretion system protein N [uncultured Sphingomonas sp.]|uniref:type II secretion system protein N n=1 Tax=uncultured Sphingomonas sp. TaxID=158754 RepID=UPI0026357585|nr:type II secretion system protein N [uncultured Sphingomonas sp.]
MRLKFDARARAILRRVPVVNVYSAAEIALLGVLAVQCARLVWTVVTPIAPLGAWAPAGPVLPGDPAGVFASFDPFYRVSGVQTQAAAITSLQLTLFGTRIDEAQGRGSAIIAGPDGVQKSVSVGEEVAPGVVLKSVAFDHVTLDRGGASENLFLPQSDGGSAPVAAPGAGAPAAPGTATPSPADLSAIPRIDGGRVTGLTLRGQGKGAFQAAGLQDGDVVTAIQGRPIGSAADLEQLQNGQATSVTIERGGQSLPVTLPGGAR